MYNGLLTIEKNKQIVYEISYLLCFYCSIVRGFQHGQYDECFISNARRLHSTPVSKSKDVAGRAAALAQPRILVRFPATNQVSRFLLEIKHFQTDLYGLRLVRITMYTLTRLGIPCLLPSYK